MTPTETTREWRLNNPARAKANDRAAYMRDSVAKSAKYSLVQQVQRRTRVGKVVLTFRQMQSRVRGQNSPQYYGLTLLPRAAFESWALSDPTYDKLFDIWATNDFSKLLSPSIDRIDPAQGYTIDNMQWVTTSANSRKARLQRPTYRRASGTFLPS